MSQISTENEKVVAKVKSRRFIKWFFLLVILFLLGLFAASWKVGSLLISTNKHLVGEMPAEFNGEKVVLTSQSGIKISGWHLVNKLKKGVVVLVHGIHASRLIMLPRAKMLYEQGYSIVMIDLQSHGESSGEQITLGFKEKDDVLAAVEYARKMHPDEKTGLIGVSLGGAAALLADPLNVDALVIESVFPDVDRAINNRVQDVLGKYAYFPTQLLLWQIPVRIGISTRRIRPIEQLKTLKCPVYIMSGEIDRHTKAEEAQEMFAAANNPKELWLVPEAGHVDLYENKPQEYQERILSFFQRYL